MSTEGNVTSTSAADDAAGFKQLGEALALDRDEIKHGGEAIQVGGPLLHEDPKAGDGSAQQVVMQRLGDLRVDVMNTTPGTPEHDRAMQRLREASLYANGLGARPAWLNQPDPRSTDTRVDNDGSLQAEADIASGIKPMAAHEKAELELRGRNMGLDEDVNADVLAIGHVAGFSTTETRTVQNILHDMGEHAVASVDEVYNTEELHEIVGKVAQQVGMSVEQFYQEHERIRAFLGSRKAANGANLLEVIDRNGISNMVGALSPRLFTVLRFAAIRAGF